MYSQSCVTIYRDSMFDRAAISTVTTTKAEYA
jgi:hypothetical protein